MQLSLRWYGPEDNVPLKHIRQVPGVVVVVNSLHDIAPGEVWQPEPINLLVDQIKANGLALTAVESLPVYEDIKLGRPDRDRYIENYNLSLRNLSSSGVTTVCYNFMPIFDWTRTISIEKPNDDRLN